MAITELLHESVTKIPKLSVDIFIPVCCVLGIIFALILWYRVSTVKVRSGEKRTGEDGRTFLLEEELTGEDSVRLPPRSLDHTPRARLPCSCRAGVAGCKMSFQGYCQCVC